MIRRDYLIVGAGAAGVSACEGIREHDKKGTIMLVGNEITPPYQRNQLFSTILRKGGAHAIEKLQVHDIAWFQKQNVDLRLDTFLTQFNIERRLAVLGNGQAVEFRKALLATGSRARRPQVAGGNLGNVFYLRSIRDVQALREIAEIEHDVVIIGGGFIALETASWLAQLPKARVALVHRTMQVWSRTLNPEASTWFAEYLGKHGIKVLLGETLNGFEGRTVLKNVQTKSGQRFAAGLAIVAVGADPNLALVANTPLAYPHGTPVSEYLETDEKGIFAAGDIAAYPDKVLGGVRRVDHWDAAVAQGHVAGANMTGRKRIKFEFLPHTTSTIFDLHFDFIGDFSKPPTRMEFEGDLAKKKFTIRMFQMSALMGVTLCNQPADKVDAAKTQLREWPRTKKIEPV
jgi:3-phenylpropionate/trans-cinnamate dioxygenase ferredoxin reductase subunit